MLRKVDEQSNNRLKDSGQCASRSSRDNATFAKAKKVRLGRDGMARLRGSRHDRITIEAVLRGLRFIGRIEVCRSGAR
jgi:hypothetical protein